MKGIILAAGKGTRLYPMTKPVCKPLLPVYDKPLIYYSIAVLMEADIRDIMIIIPPDEEETFRKLLGDGSAFGVHITYAVQYVARGIADAFLVAEDFVAGDSACLVLGDNIFYAKDLCEKLKQGAATQDGATVFGYYVEDPRAFGVVEFDEHGKAISLEEKPKHPKSNYIIPGLYFYDSDVLQLAKTLQPSARGELEITDLNRLYLESGKLQVIPLASDFVWMDAGTADSLLEAAQQIKQIQQDTGRYVACLEEIAYKHGYLSEEQVEQAGEKLNSTLYGQYLQCISAER
ncbi:glucose-1-phosphate thymidylyltransferase RfbA [Butyricicoccus sp.]|uniref:glucose-1-phosphate thymidylyltransferase RfbA n=1 Tax=Butyricicoccus sp. TaxID=2049021 RepID=UPI003D7E4291